jgi:exonuclease III
MTPKEKAEELVEKMFSLSTTNAFPAKQCALIAVDEIIKVVNDIWLDSFKVGENNNKFYSYWEQVKTEINNI